MPRLPKTYLARLAKEIDISRKTLLTAGEINPTQSRLIMETIKIFRWQSAKATLQTESLFGNEVSQ